MKIKMAANTKSTTTNATAKSTSAKRSESTQVREGLTKARRGTVDYVRQSAERAVDVPVGAALTARDRVNDAVEPWTQSETRERELKSLRTQVTRELNRFERRGGQARRKATQSVRTTRNRVERELKARRREVTRTVKQNRVKAEEQLKKAQTTVQERVPVLP
ncbi:MAG: hypothetical protein ACRDK9_00590 [Solirubrobacterales bacterium]